MTTSLTPDTRAVRAGLENCDVTGAVVPPLHLSSTYAFRGFGDKRKYDYSRSGNPTRDLLAEALADLEGGAGAVITGSGMGAITLVGSPAAGRRARRRAARLLRRHVPAVHRLAEARRTRGRVRRFRQCGRGDRGAVEARGAGVDRNAQQSAAAHHRRRRHRDARRMRVGALVVADNTFLSPGWQQPIALGADIVVHSTTKYINGHSDVVGGAVIAAKQEVAEQLGWWGNCLGLTGSRVRQLSHAARACARCTCGCANTARTRRRWPNSSRSRSRSSGSTSRGLPQHPGHEIAKRQQSGFGAIVTLEVQGGVDGAQRFSEALELFSLAESLGGVESLVAHPATMTHAAMAPEARAAAGLVDGLLRLSIGIESTEDLLRDLQNGIGALGIVRRARSHAAGDGRGVAAGRRDFAALAVHVVRPCPVGERMVRAVFIAALAA